MVSIQNPAVSIPDIWAYQNRTVTNSTEVSATMINSLLNSVLGQEFDQNSVGYYLTKGIAQDVADITKNITPFTYSYIRPMSNSPLARLTYSRSFCGDGGGSSVQSAGSVLDTPSTFGDRIFNNTILNSSVSDQYLIGLVDYPKDQCVNDTAAYYRCSITAVADSGSLGSYTAKDCSKFTYSDNEIITYTTANYGSGGHYAFSDNLSVLNKDGTYITPTERSGIKPIIQNDSTEQLPFILTLSNVQKSNFNGVFVSFGRPLFQNLTGELIINDVTELTFKMPKGSDYYATPSDWSRLDITPGDVIQIKLTDDQSIPVLCTPVKSIIVNSILTQPT